MNYNNDAWTHKHQNTKL